MTKKRETDVTQVVATTACYGTISYSPVNAAPISKVELLEQENEKLLGAVMRQQECIKLLVSYLDAPMKARSKLADIERLLR